MKIAIITGASSGIGTSLARKFSKENYEVYLVGRNEKRLSALQSELKNPAKIFSCDLLNTAAVRQLLAQWGEDSNLKKNLSVLINNAGAFDKKPLLELTESDLEKQYRLQILIPTLLAQFCFHYLSQHAQSGSIINVSSTLALRPIAQTAHYSAAKAALNSLTQSMAIEMAPKVRVNSVCPGVVDTPIHGQPDSATREFMDSVHLLQRMGKPEEIAELVFFLASSFSQWTTGSVVSIDGGIGLK